MRPPAGYVDLATYSPEWPACFEHEKTALQRAFAPAAVDIEHVGSTSVPSLGAKPVIDILLGARSLGEIEARIPELERHGYRYRPELEALLPQRRYFARREEGGLGFHVHAVVHGELFWREHLAFRNLLRADAALALEYFALKSRLAEDFRTDRGAYTEAKAPFIRKVVGSAVLLEDFRPEHSSGLVPMWRESFEHGVGIVDPHPLAEQERYFRSVVLPDNTVKVATLDGLLVGFVAASRTSIAQLYVRKDFHRRGVGSRLLDWAKRQSEGSLSLFTFARNSGARAFYERHGFRIVARGFEPQWRLDDLKYAWSNREGAE